MEQNTMKCPYYGEEILAVAKKCRYCGSWLDGHNETAPTPEHSAKPHEAPKIDSHSFVKNSTIYIPNAATTSYYTLLGDTNNYIEE